MNLPLLEATEYQPVATRPGPAGRRVYIETYGCQMNVADSELVASILADAGFQITERAEQADIILLNTCAVREHAEERVIGPRQSAQRPPCPPPQPHFGHPRLHGPTPEQDPVGPRSFRRFGHGAGFLPPPAPASRPIQRRRALRRAARPL